MKASYKLYEKVTEKYGFEAQREKWIEELLELICELQKSKFKEVDHNIREEMADVQICIEQMRMHYGYMEVDIWKKNKLRRLSEKLEKD